MCRSPSRSCRISAAIPKYEALGYLVGGCRAGGRADGPGRAQGALGRADARVFTACTIVFVHHFWDMEGAAYTGNMTQALKNLSIIGGLLLVVGGRLGAERDGPPLTGRR